MFPEIYEPCKSWTSNAKFTRPMLREKLLLPSLIIAFAFISSCEQKEIVDQPEDATVEQPETTESTKGNYAEQHPYGGWYCPDNFGGFPPVDVQDLDQVPVVNDRLPTEEETRNGTSLMFFDQTEYPDARPLEMELPRLARIYSKHSEMDELIIVIQAAVAGNDTVVGFRYPSGGNGTAWFGQVTFLSDEESNAIGPAPFVYLESEISASKEKIWKAITSTSYAKNLGKKFDEKAFFDADWTEESHVQLNLEADGVRATGFVASVWGNLYLQIDYDNNGVHFSEKMLVAEKPMGHRAELHIVSGPYPNDIEAQQAVWANWLEEVIALSETY